MSFDLETRDTLLLVFFAAIETVGRRGALLALLFLVFSPVHILYSRQAHAGACLPPLFAALTVFLLLRSFKAIEFGGKRDAFGSRWQSVGVGRKR